MKYQKLYSHRPIRVPILHQWAGPKISSIQAFHFSFRLHDSVIWMKNRKIESSTYIYRIFVLIWFFTCSLFFIIIIELLKSSVGVCSGPCVPTGAKLGPHGSVAVASFVKYMLYVSILFPLFLSIQTQPYSSTSARSCAHLVAASQTS